MALKAIDFFCGIGGVTRGFLNSGIDVVAGIDIDSQCRKTYETNNIRPNGNPSKFFCEDINSFDVSKINEFISREDKLIVIGCAPCQPFTDITQNLIKRNKERELLKRFAEIILQLEPEYLFLENVQGLNSPKNKDILEGFLQLLAPTFLIKPQVINAMNYGVPQSRKRIILFAKRNSKIDYPSATHGIGENLQPLKTLRDAIGNLPPISSGERHTDLFTHVCAQLTEINLHRLSYQTMPGDGMETWPPELFLNSRRVKTYVGHKDVYSRLRWDQPSGTLTTKFSSISNGRFAHPVQNRGLSILEGLLIQSFPADYKLLSPHVRRQARQIGNAVPVKLAEAFANKILESEISGPIVELQATLDFQD